ncbi:MAG TPA: hypothetical protein VK742_08050 [Candidatus Sulfotelmatobacter sp.]|jgi:hypothetical protein|nr:hypothetical protein [Candidatus Sulfotelmatobacter sp.]
MRIRIILLAGLGLIAANAFADEQMATLKVGDTVYHNVTITKASADEIFFISNEGMGNAKMKDLDAETRQHFRAGPDPAARPKPASANPAVQYHFRVVDPTNAPAAPADVKLELNDALNRVREIVNQPVHRFKQTPDMVVSVYNQGWFHPGSTRPDFNTVDIRKTQELNYATQAPYVTSDITPGVVFLGSELEFNPMTKCFYTDRTVPKKKLTEAEMLEINRLYRIIGNDEAKLFGQPAP